MIIVLKDNPDQKQLENLVSWLKSMGLDIHMSKGQSATIMGLIGENGAGKSTTISAILNMKITKPDALDIVETVKRVQEPYKNVNRKFHPEDTVVEVIPGVKIGGGNFQVIAGPCSVESEEQICLVAEEVKKAGAGMLRGGAFKPRTSPYAFQGMRGEGIELLLEAKEKTGLPIVTEVMDISQLPLFENVDVIQVGARNMQNFELLKEVGRLRKPILLKRGLANTLKELLMSAEYIMAGGNENVILCERGIRTFETATRNTLDLASIPLLRTMTHLPIVVDPSHATGIAGLVKPMAMAATAAGADGLMIEVHNNPPSALCDGAQSLTPAAFADVMDAGNLIRPAAYKG